MAIQFSHERWQKVADDARRWWAGTLGRPLIQVRLYGADPGRPEPAIPPFSRDTVAYDERITPQQIVERWNYDLAGMRFLGDAFPQVLPDFGPGVIAAFLGARPEPGQGTVWFQPERTLAAGALRLQPDLNNRWLQRIIAIGRAAQERWGSLVQVDMTDLGGNLDIVSSFLPGEQLLLALYDEPAEVERLLWEAHAAWWQVFETINQSLQPINPGYTSWATLFSPAPFYMLQCDFAYMIGPDMFDRFVKPELVASCRRLANAFYHLDGPGQLAHLDSLLAIPELKGIQWVPGAGQPSFPHWPEVYRKIQQAGKSIHLFADVFCLPEMEKILGSLDAVVLTDFVHVSRRTELERLLHRYGADWPD